MHKYINTNNPQIDYALLCAWTDIGVPLRNLQTRPTGSLDVSKRLKKPTSQWRPFGSCYGRRWPHSIAVWMNWNVP